MIGFHLILPGVGGLAGKVGLLSIISNSPHMFKFTEPTQTFVFGRSAFDYRKGTLTSTKSASVCSTDATVERTVSIDG